MNKINITNKKEALGAVTIKGTLMFPFLTQARTSTFRGVTTTQYETDVVVTDESSLATLTALGANARAKGDHSAAGFPGKVFKVKSKYPPMIRLANGSKLGEGTTIGNGTEVTVEITPRPYDGGVSLYVTAVRIDNLKEYVPTQQVGASKLLFPTEGVI